MLEDVKKRWSVLDEFLSFSLLDGCFSGDLTVFKYRAANMFVVSAAAIWNGRRSAAASFLCNSLSVAEFSLARAPSCHK